jgi:hypothetical protein
MSSRRELSFKIIHEVLDRRLCLHLQRAARSAARRFDQAFRTLDLTNAGSRC